MAQDFNSEIEERIKKLEEKVSLKESSCRQDLPDVPLGYFQYPQTSSVKPKYTIDLLVKVLLEHKGSDLHIQADNPPAIRIGGDIVPIGKDALTNDEIAAILLPCLNDITKQRLEKHHEVDFAYQNASARFRVNMFLSQGKLSAAFRYLRADMPTVDELGLPDILKQIALLHNGLVLVTGPAGSGKSTTLAAMIEHINAHKKTHIVTLEEPIEFVHKNKFSFITQREVGADTISFYEGLKMALRQDPNVVLIGEMRDSETIMTAILAAETGHLVLSTLHTPNTIQAINRIVDAFPENQQKQFRLLLSNVLRCVTSQRLINKVGSHERVVAAEVMVPTSTIRGLIAEGNLSDIYQMIQEGKQDGMQTFTQALVNLYQKGVITKEDALYYADQPTEFQMGIEGHQTGTFSESEGSLIDWM